MLETLHIRNFALIDELVIPWKPGLNVLTGETGAGKSIIVDAMSLLLGGRASATYVKSGEQNADIEALFDITACLPVKELLESLELDGSQEEVLLRRVVTADGKSRCFLNGSMVTLNLLSKVGDLLVDMHGQHEHQSLMQPGKHLSLLDEFGGLGAETAFIRQGYNELKHWLSILERLIARESNRNQRLAELEEQLDLLEKAQLREGEDEELKSRRDVIAHSEQIHRLAGQAYDMLSGGEMHSEPLTNIWNSIMQALKGISSIDRSFGEVVSSYEEIQYRFSELGQMLQSYISRLEFDPAELDALERRLAEISKLKRRFDCDSLQALIDVRERLRAEYDQLVGSSSERAKLQQDIDRQREEIGKLASVLSQKRNEAAQRLEKQVQLHLHDLGMSNARFVVSIEQEQVPDGLVRYKNKNWRLWSTGVDKVEFLFSANPGEPPRPLRAIASGGEISRIMLAIRTILAEADKVPVIIFDEIDSGVGARMGMAIAEKLFTVSSSHQVICVTHLPQIAARADNHVVVSKQAKLGRTRTEVIFPTGRDRVVEIARMMGGEATGQISLKHAQELLALSRRNR
ncbi:MAG: DNA repair protein RecN [Candidatus Abyssubacteria bacterium]